MRIPNSKRKSSNDWWRSAVIYQIYPRSFSDSDGDGTGDLAGIIDRIHHLSDLGIDAIWLSPFFCSPQKDAGYDVSDYCSVDPIFGTLDDFKNLISKAHALNLRVIVDLVPNHSSDQHEWFRKAVLSDPGSPERDRYIFMDSNHAKPDSRPNNWESVFGGPAWTQITEPNGAPGQWYLHLFDSSQPDLNWQNSEIRDLFRDILRFWLDLGIDGFRVDVAHGLIKKKGFPDKETSATPAIGHAGPHWDQEAVHEIYRDWRELLDEYGSDRILCAEAWVMPLSRLARYVRPDEMNHAFNFGYLATPWDASALKQVIKDSIRVFGQENAPSTWVLSNHDMVRHVSRFGLDCITDPQPTGIGPNSPEKPDEARGLTIARAATMLMLALPGSAYIYQGEELGLPEVIDIPDADRQDPTFFRTNGQRYGRDGCRVPIPWEANKPAFGFNSTGASWLPQPQSFYDLSRDRQEGVKGSTLELYKSLIRLRTEHHLGSGNVEWLSEYGHNVIAFRNRKIMVIVNLGEKHISLPTGKMLLSSVDLEKGKLPQNAAAWVG